jgi:hypothetical protein
LKPAGNPWMKFYPSDWRADPALRSCTIAARGLWVEMLCIMHEAVPYGSLLINGARVDKKRLAALAGLPERECTSLLLELEGFGVFSREEDGTVYSRRMRRDEAKAIKDKENGKKGGNPSVKGGVNPMVNGKVKAQKPEAFLPEKDSEANASGAEAPLNDPSQAERDYFARGRDVLGKSAGGQLAKLLKANGGNVSLSRSTLELAATKHKPAEFFARSISPTSQGPPPGKGGFFTVLMDKHRERQDGTGDFEAADPGDFGLASG